MTSTSNRIETARSNHQRDWFVVLGLAVSASAAAVSSFDGLASLASGAGWPHWMAPLLPATVDALAATATRLWISSVGRVRRMARVCALGTILLSLSGNAAAHLVSAHLLGISSAVVLAVGACPPLVLAAISHLAALLKGQTEERSAQPARKLDSSQPYPAIVDESGLPPGSPARVPAVRNAVPRSGPARAEQPSVDELLAAARMADTAYRAAQERGITRDALRAELRISGAKASRLLRELRAETGAH